MIAIYSHWDWLQAKRPSKRFRYLDNSIKFFRDNHPRYCDLHALKGDLDELGIASPPFDEQYDVSLGFVEEEIKRRWQSFLMRLYPLAKYGRVRKARMMAKLFLIPPLKALDNMRIQNLTTKSNELIQWLDEHIYDFNLIEDAHSRSRLAVSCFYVALEHQRAIVLLISHNLHGSARALVRILFDAFIRGLWLFRCASDDDLEYFKKEDDLKKKFEDRIKDIEKLSGDDEKILSMIKSNAWSAMCSYTHTGMSQLSRYNSSEAIGPNFNEDEILEALNFANVFGLLSALWMAAISGNDDLVNVLREKINEYNEYSEQIFRGSNPDSS